MRVLVAGGTSGLGLSMARQLTAEGHLVYSLGRKDPSEPGLTFVPFDLAQDDLGTAIDKLLNQLLPVDLLIYAAGFRQVGRLGNLSDSSIEAMLRIKVAAPTLLLNALLGRLTTLEGYISIGSSSGYIRRPDEPVYSPANSYLTMLTDCLEPDQIRKVLAVEPSGMRTPFWVGAGRNTANDLDPDWVAGEILTEFFHDDFEFRHIRIKKNPRRVEVIEAR